jgi:class 3 adenylate cyclase
MDNKESKKKSMWFLYEASITPMRCAELIERNKPVQENFFEIFSLILKKYLLLLNRREGVHFFFNVDSDEIHFIFHKYGPEIYKFESSEKRYKCKKEKDIRKFFEQLGFTGQRKKDQPQIKQIGVKTLKSFFGKIDLGITIAEDEKVMVIPFNWGEIDLGAFIIWGERNAKKKFRASGEDIQPWVSSWYRFLSELFVREYKVDKQTYLPSYFTSDWKKVAVLFADIRNFTPLTEILRNRLSQSSDTAGILGKIMREFCKEMCDIIHNNINCRIDKFMGDGIMVVCGEYENDHSKIVCEAIYVATEMVKKFEKLKIDWQEMAFGEGYNTEFNESVEIDLGIGIDFGSVFFDFLGDEVHREYSAVGDHVNFASRLQGMAAREDEKIHKKMPHIIISSTAFRCCKPWLKKIKELKLDIKGKSYQYKCFGIEPEDFDVPLYSNSQALGDWELAWKDNDSDWDHPQSSQKNKHKGEKRKGDKLECR